LHGAVYLLSIHKRITTCNMCKWW